MAAGYEEAYQRLRQLPLFDGLPNQDLAEAISRGELKAQTYYRDEVVADGYTLATEGPRICLVMSGQIAVAMFPDGVLENERAWMEETKEEERQKKVRSQGPLISLAEKNLATFGEGDLFNTEAIPAASSQNCAFYAVEPCDLIVFSKARMAHFTSTFPFFAQRLRRAVEVARDRLTAIKGVKQEIFDFYVRHGLSVAQTLRVRQVDRCIECKECEKACEERYGHKRLSIYGPRLGMLDFIFTCRTCVDQRCVDPCNYDSIRYDERRKEVVINEATCTGCAACAVACPYGAIEMVDIEDPRKRGLKLRLDAQGALAYGPGTGRKARLEKIASKCDHCMSYSDQACVSHCPTGALIEIKPSDLFSDKAEVARMAARSGFDRTVVLDAADMMDAEKFKRGLNIKDFGDAKAKRRRIQPALIWGLGVLAFLVCTTEILLRMFKPEWSFQYVTFRAEGLEPAIAAIKVNYRPGGDFAVWMGYIGTALMVIAMLYPLRKRIQLLQKISTSASWFDFHMMGGVVGPMFIVLHSALKLDNWVSAAFWSMVMVVLSGLVGRYLYVQVPERMHSRELDDLEAERALARANSTSPDAVSLLRNEVTAYRQRCQLVIGKVSLLGAFLWLLWDDFKRPGRWLIRKVRLARTSAQRRTRRELARHTGRLLLSERRRVFLPRVHNVLQHWIKVHVPFTFILAVLSIIHIAVALTYSM